MSDVSHEQIYERLIAVEGKVDRIDNNTKGLVDAIDALDGAFKVLGWVASLAKPILWIGGLVMAAGAIWRVTSSAVRSSRSVSTRVGGASIASRSGSKLGALAASRSP